MVPKLDIETAAHVSDVVHGPFFASLGVWYFPYCLLFSVLSVTFIMEGPIFIICVYYPFNCLPHLI